MAAAQLASVVTPPPVRYWPTLTAGFGPGGSVPAVCPSICMWLYFTNNRSAAPMFWSTRMSYWLSRSELGQANVSGNPRPFLFEIEPGPAHGAVVHVLRDDPVSGQA